ncbi:MAG: energy transducer TonB [Vulcanimicrobiaceae bacterium]
MATTPTPPKPPKQPPNPTVVRTRNFLAYGFIISIALHLVFGPFVKFKNSQTTEEAPQHVTVVHVPTPPPTPKPTPTPHPTPPPTPPPNTPPPQTPAPPQPKIKINTLKLNSKSSGPSEVANKYTTGNTAGIPQGNGTGPPVAAVAATPAPATPVPTPTPLACARPNVPAGTVHTVEPDTPAMAQQQGISGTVQVQVSLDEHSKIIGLKIYSSPSSLLNPAALAAARQSTFQTEIKDCKPIAEDYLFSVEFDSQ